VSVSVVDFITRRCRSLLISLMRMSQSLPPRCRFFAATHLPSYPNLKRDQLTSLSLRCVYPFQVPAWAPYGGYFPIVYFQACGKPARQVQGPPRCGIPRVRGNSFTTRSRSIFPNACSVNHPPASVQVLKYSSFDFTLSIPSRTNPSHRPPPALSSFWRSPHFELPELPLGPPENISRK